VIGQGVWILWGVENCHLPLTKPVAVNNRAGATAQPVITVSEQSNEKSAVQTFLEETSFCQSFLPKLIMRELNKEDAMDRCKWRMVIKEAR